MKIKVSITLTIILNFLLAACGSPPLVMPENIETATGSAVSSQPEQAVEKQPPLAQPTATVEVVEGNARSPLAPPTATAVIKPIEVIATPTAMPFFITPIYSPTPAPSPSPTPTFEPLSDKPILGYVFGKPEEIQGLDNSVIKEWLPGSSEEMITLGGDFLELVNILTEEKYRLAQWSSETYAFTGNQVWVSSIREATLILFNIQTSRYELWVNASEKKPVEQPDLTNVSSSFIPVDVITGLGVYDLETRTLNVISDQGKLVEVVSQPLRPVPTSTETLPYSIAKSNDKVTFYNRDDFLIVNLKTKTVKGVEFADEQGRSLSAWDAKWSWEGRKLALLLSERNPTLNFMDLYIYDSVDNTLQKVETPFTRYVDAIAWAPDNHHLLVNAVIGDAEYKTTLNDSVVSDANAIFIVDTVTREYSPIPFYSPDTASSIGQVLWSPDGKYLVIRYRFYDGETNTYRIRVK
jgi:hypothetical protein